MRHLSTDEANRFRRRGTIGWGVRSGGGGCTSRLPSIDFSKRLLKKDSGNFVNKTATSSTFDADGIDGGGSDV